MKIDLQALRKIAKAAPQLVVSELVAVLGAVVEVERDQIERERLANKRQQDATAANNDQQMPTPPKTQQQRENEIYELAKSVCGRNSGSFANTLLKAHAHDTAAVAAVFLNAKMKADPRAYIVAECRRHGNGTGANPLAGVDDLIAREKARTGVDDGPLLDLTPTSSRTG